ncbi:MAG: hypothetical protein ABF326_12850 [Arenicellales bacterium]
MSLFKDICCTRPCVHKQYLFLKLQQIASALLLFSLLSCETLFASEATMLPAGVYRTRLYVTLAEADSVYDADGNKQSFEQLYKNALIDNGVPVDVKDVYRIDTGGKFSMNRYDLYIEYGLTDDIGFGAWMQYFDISNNADAVLTTESGWTMLSGTQQSAIIGATDYVDSLDTSVSALGDTVIGMKHRLLGDNRSKYRFAYHAGVRIPTGHVADPLNRSDMSTGDGQVDLGIWLSFDYQPHPRFFVNLQTRHEYQLAGTRDVLDPSDTTRTLEMEFQPGFINYAEIDAWYFHPLGEAELILKLMSTYYLEGDERQQSFDNALGRFTGSLVTVDGTDSALWTIQPHIGVSLFPMGIPVRTMLSYSIPIEGVNLPAAEFVQLRVDFYF